MKKLVIFLTIASIVVAFFAGCGKEVQPVQKENIEKSAHKAESKENKSEDGYPMTVKDGKGVEVVIPKKPERIISLSLGTDEILLSLVDKDRIRALSYLSDDPGISNVAEKAKGITEKVGQEIESVIALGPDLVLLPDWHDESFIQQLRDAQIPVYAYKTPSSIEEQKQMIMNIAHLLGEEDRGQEIVAWMNEKLREVEEKVKAVKPEDKLRVINNNFGYTYAKGTVFDDIVQRAGLINAASEDGLELWIEITKEKIVELNPDMIIIPSWSFDKDLDPSEFLQQIKNDKSLAEVSAVRNDRVVMVPEKHVSAISQYVVLAVEDIAKAAYPKLFK